ncbi:hypothetical protein J2Y68_003222 [Paenarthrobacter nitroguajacolicus]|nr:hypothetical protein [Paenarthrobacter nitroguajacolicus]
MDISRRQTETPGMLEVHAKHASEVDDALTKAIDVVKIAATEYKIGILVSRIDAGRYIVRAHPAVPFGLVRQQHESLDGRRSGSAGD